MSQDEFIITTETFKSYSSQTLRSVEGGNPNLGGSRKVGFLKKGKPSKQASDAWEHFIITEGCDPEFYRVACKYCWATYACDSESNGITNLIRNLDKCKKYTSQRIMLKEREILSVN